MSDKNDQYHVVYTDEDTAKRIELYCVVYGIHKSVLIRGILSNWLEKQPQKQELVTLMSQQILREWDTYQAQQRAGTREKRTKKEFLRAMELKYRGQLKDTTAEVLKLCGYEKD